MSSIPIMSLDKREPKIEEIIKYLRLSKLLFYGLVMAMTVNSILTYGLIFHPTKPSLETCLPFCPKGQSRELFELGNTTVTTDLVSPSIKIEVETEDSNQRSSRTDLADIEARWDYGDVRVGVFLAMGGYWFTNQAIQWWNMVYACRDLTNASNGVNCVWGAITTVITATGTLYKAYTGYGHISTWLSNNGISIGGFRRQEIQQGLLDELTNVFGAEVSHLGVWSHSLPGIKTVFNKQDNASTPVNVFGFNANGVDLHFSFLGNTTHGPTFRFGLGSGNASTTINQSPSNSSSKEKRTATTWDEQYFTSGGIDFVLFQNPDAYNYPSGSALNTNSDYNWIYDQVSCIMDSGMTAAGHWFQLYDYVHQGTMAAGAVAPFSGSNHWSAITKMEDPKGGLQLTPGCSTVSEKRTEDFHA